MLHSTTFAIPCIKTNSLDILDRYKKEYITLSQALESRERLSKSLNNCREPEFLKVAFEGYLSLLPELGKVLEKFQDNSKTNIQYQWQSTLSSSGKFFSDSFFAFEVAMALTAYATLKLCLAEQNFVSEEEQEINQVSRYLCEAAGIFEYLQDNILPECIIQASIPTPPDIHPNAAAFMNRLALGLAQEKVIHKAQLRCSSEMTLLKLCNAAVQMFTQALAKVSSIQGCEPVTSTILKFAEFHLLLSKAMSCFYLGKVSDMKMEHGLKVACLRYCCEILQKQQIQKLLGKFSFTKLTCSQRALSIEAYQLYQLYQKQNSTVYHEREPDWSTIVYESERLLVKSIPFMLLDNSRTTISQRLQNLRIQEPKEQAVSREKPHSIETQREEDKRKSKNSRNRRVFELCTE
ncbi:hypothetical protein GpartN1_g4495.t1 [Galdieria partita]|uniref:BRO1 domain-containing protein n=1 Tax=Galdieria partita TaxID=83374 RepID=A0A9C7PY40_9RHOD|nr:hypothetical protein GpartN1_g4495.t1 [Galdieria partita]